MTDITANMAIDKLASLAADHPGAFDGTWETDAYRLRNIVLNAMSKREDEIARLREDAERYRWLRDQCTEADIVAGLGWIRSGHESLDAAIDAARHRDGDEQ